MTRLVLSEENLTQPALKAITKFHKEVVEEVISAIASNRVVVVGMAQNPVVKKATSALLKANISFKYIEHGSYFSKWRVRLAIKLWSGWPTFPQVFVDGKLVGGYYETNKLLNAKELV